MRYDNRTHGRTSAENPIDQALAEAWEIAKTMNADCKQGEWVPKRSIYIDTDILPRHHAQLDHNKVREYAEVFRQLPPIKVQKDTFVLIAGHHRLHASFEPTATTDLIRIEEMDVAYDQLWIEAFNDNRAHGIPYTKADRIDHLQRLIDAFPQKTIEWYAIEAGVSTNTARKYAHDAQGPRYNTRQPEVMDSNVQIAHSNPVRVGVAESHNEPRDGIREVPAPVIRSGLSTSAELWTEWIKKASEVPDDVIEEVARNKQVASEMVWRIATITEQGGMLK